MGSFKKGSNMLVVLLEPLSLQLEAGIVYLFKMAVIRAVYQNHCVRVYSELNYLACNRTWLW